MHSLFACLTLEIDQRSSVSKSIHHGPKVTPVKALLYTVQGDTMMPLPHIKLESSWKIALL